MRILVCGGRNYSDQETFDGAMEQYLGSDTVIIEGGARGADRMAKNWANENHVALETYSADWDKHGRAAGYIRNKQMLDEGKPDLVMAFPGGKGTAMMVKIAKEAGVKVIKIT